MYTTPTCVYCKKTKGFFKEHNITYQEKDVSTDHAAAEEMIQKSGQYGVPVIDIDGKLIIGFDKPQLSQLLGIQ